MQIEIIGAPLALGQPHDGVRLAPQALRDAGLVATLEGLGHIVHDQGDLVLPTRTPQAESARPYYIEAIGPACGEIADKVAAALQVDHFPLTLGGDHSIGIGTVCGLLRARPEAIVLWIDAHGDLNTPVTSPSGNVHGMALAALLGRIEAPLTVEPCLPHKHLALFGIRSLDPGERTLLREEGVHVTTMHDIDRKGIFASLTQALQTLDPEGLRPIYVSFDIDVLDPSEAPGTGTPVRGGLSYREAHLLLELLAESGRLCAMDLVEVNPTLDHKGQTVHLGVELIASALGKTIL